MPLILGWNDIAVRLIFTVIAGAVIGWNRGEHGHPAGLRTTVLVCLAASLSMIETNLLLGTRGKSSDSFAVLDLARFPLGILSGMGFIGAGAILRRGRVVEGVTTAATLWFVTMVGLCIGGGQLGLGIVGTVIGYIVLSLLKQFEDFVGMQRRATFDITLISGSEMTQTLAAQLSARGYQVLPCAGNIQSEEDRCCYQYEIRWRARENDEGPARLLEEIGGSEGVLELRWRMGAP